MPALTPRQELLQRMRAMASGWGSIGLVYGLSAWRPVEQAYLLQPGPIDLWFRFDPRGIWLYLSFFALVPLAYFLCAERRLAWLTRAMHVTALGAALVFAVFPTTMHFPPVTTTGPSADLLRLLIEVDTLINCLPSLHVALSILALAALWQDQQPWRNGLLALWVLLICLSILQLHRHQFVDLLAGAVLALVAGLWSWRQTQAKPARPHRP